MESGRIFDEEKDTINLAYREGTRDCLYAINVGERLLLIIVIHNGLYASRIGSVWYYAQQTATNMRRILGDADFASPSNVFEETSEEELQNELDNLFPSEQTSDGTQAEEYAASVDESRRAGGHSDEKSTMTYDEAIEAGLLPSNQEGIERQPPS
jgi:hypothetical protein